MKLNRIAILSIFILAVFLMGAVSAEDNATDADGQIAQDINARLKTAAGQDFIYEGVDLSPVFNAVYYGSRYPDL